MGSLLLLLCLLLVLLLLLTTAADAAVADRLYLHHLLAMCCSAKLDLCACAHLTVWNSGAGFTSEPACQQIETSCTRWSQVQLQQQQG